MNSVGARKLIIFSFCLRIVIKNIYSDVQDTHTKKLMQVTQNNLNLINWSLTACS